MIPSLNYAVLTDALHALKEGNIRHCEALGFTYNELEAINCLSMDELFILSRASAQFLNITIQHEVLRQLLAQTKQEIHLQQRINRAIALGGSIELLSQFFGLSSSEISARRRFIGISVSQGRTRIPDEDTDARIWRQWQQHRPETLLSMGTLDVMMDITETLSGTTEDESLSLTVVWNRIMLCEKERQGEHNYG
jgi:AraC-like DNA-binding protein